MLVKLERIPEATKYALKSFKRPDEALALAGTLRDAAAHDDALKIAEAGLGLAGDEDDEMDGSAIPLAHWLRVFDNVDCCVTPVLRLDETLAHPLFGECATV